MCQFLGQSVAGLSWQKQPPTVVLLTVHLLYCSQHSSAQNNWLKHNLFHIIIAIHSQQNSWAVHQTELLIIISTNKLTSLSTSFVSSVFFVFVFRHLLVVKVPFCSLLKGITTKIRTLSFDLINSILLSRVCVWTLLAHSFILLFSIGKTHVYNNSIKSEPVWPSG